MRSSLQLCDAIQAACKLGSNTLIEARLITNLLTGGPLQALRYLLNVCVLRNITAYEGEFISTGAVTGVHSVDLTSHCRVEFVDLGGFDLAFDSIKPNR